MTKTWIFEWLRCRWAAHWLTAAARAKLRHLAFGATIACTGITVVPPPANAPPPPLPPVVAPPPPPPFGHIPSVWGYVPPETPSEGVYLPAQPIPLGPVLDVSPGPQEAGRAPFEIGSLPPLCDTPAVVGPKQGVPEPGGVLLLGMALGIIGLLRYARPPEASVRFVVLSTGEEK